MTDKKLLRISREFREEILNGGPSCLMCAAVSWPLQSYLSAWCGVSSDVVKVELEGVNHVFLKLRDGRVLDPTADQFGDLKLPPVYLGEPLEIHRNAGEA